METKAKAILWLLAVVLVLLAISIVLQTMTAQVANTLGVLWPWQKLADAANGVQWHSVVNVIGSVLVGAMGAWAFHLGLITGFIDRPNRKTTLEFLQDGSGNTKWPLSFWFYVTGGMVAGVFQMAQADTFAPIQGFVLGATWPSVVTRIMSGAAGVPPSQGPNVKPAQVDVPQTARGGPSGEVTVEPTLPVP